MYKQIYQVWLYYVRNGCAICDTGSRRPKFSCIIFMCCEYDDFDWLYPHGHLWFDEERFKQTTPIKTIGLIRTNMSLRVDGHVDQDKNDYPSFRVSEIITIQLS